jgi:hypothetical protein
MIRYALACDGGHAFESWFANSATYDRQVKRGLVSCPVCNSTKEGGPGSAANECSHAGRHDVAAGARVPQEAEGIA